VTAESAVRKLLQGKMRRENLKLVFIINAEETQNIYNDRKMNVYYYCIKH